MPYLARNQGLIDSETTFDAAPQAVLWEVGKLPGLIVLECVKCNGLTTLVPCFNCGGTQFGFAPVPGNEDGIVCKKCNVSWPRWTCANCSVSNPSGTTVRCIWDDPPSLDRPSNCFVASIALHDSDWRMLISLRRYRDEVLSRGTFGRAAIAMYQLIGPIIAGSISGAPRVRSLVRRAIILPAGRIVERRLKRLDRGRAAGRTTRTNKLPP